MRSRRLCVLPSFPSSPLPTTSLPEVTVSLIFIPMPLFKLSPLDMYACLWTFVNGIILYIFYCYLLASSILCLGSSPMLMSIVYSCLLLFGILLYLCGLLLVDIWGADIFAIILDKYFLSTYYVPGTTLGIGIEQWSKLIKSLPPWVF